MNIILLGKPGAGKGYISGFLCGEFNFKHFSTGEIIRQNINAGTPLGDLAKSYTSKGELVPDDVIIDMVQSALKKERSENIIFDGFPRTINQAKALEKIAEIHGALFIDVPDKIIIDRISSRISCSGCGKVYNAKTYLNATCASCGGALVKRQDDDEKVVLNRLSEYEVATKPLIDYYKKQNKLFVIDNSQEPSKAFAAAKEVITGLMK